MSNVHVIAERELPMQEPVPPIPPLPQHAQTPQPQRVAPSNQPPVAVYAAIAQALTGRIHAFLLLLSCVAIGLIAAIWPSELRLYMAAGYGVFGLLGLWIVRK